jgi:hypothetical protein
MNLRGGVTFGFFGFADDFVSGEGGGCRFFFVIAVKVSFDTRLLSEIVDKGRGGEEGEREGEIGGEGIEKGREG